MLARCPLHDEQFEFLQQHIKSFFFKMGPNMKILIFSKTCAVGSFYEKESGDLGWLGLVGILIYNNNIFAIVQSTVSGLLKDSNPLLE